MVVAEVKLLLLMRADVLSIFIVKLVKWALQVDVAITVVWAQQVVWNLKFPMVMTITAIVTM